jgi:hypothetical protein
LGGAERFDVAVVGGGCAGVAAAVSAAEAGARTVLVERADRLGGNASLAFVHTLCGLYLPADAGDARPAHPGFPARFAFGLAACGGAGEPERAGRVWFRPTDPARLAAYARALCEGTRGLSLRLSSELVGAELRAGEEAPLTLRLRGPGGAPATLRAALAVDASGDAALAAALGARLDEAPPEALQHPSYIVRLAGVDTRALEPFARLRVSHAVAGAARHGGLAPGWESALVRPVGAPAAAGEAFLQLNVPKLPGRPYAPLDPAYREALEAEARRGVEAVIEYLRGSREEFRAAAVTAWPARIGLRETRRVVGEVVVTRADVLAGRRRDDEVALSTWPIELWSDHRRARFEHGAGPCSIPLGALVAEGLSRLGVAGRCASASHEAMGALRVLGTAMAMGEAVGVAAALAADAGAELPAIAPARVRDHILARESRR